MRVPQGSRAGGTGFARAAIASAVAVLLVAPPAADADPRAGATAEVRPVSGVVTVTKPGQQRATRLRGPQTIRLGSTIDAASGTVRLTTAKDPRGGTQTGVFREGAFVVRQTRGSRPYTVLDLAKGEFGGCQAAAAGVFDTAGARRAVRRLWGRAKGRFRTRGRRGTATIRGTTWVTEDTCQTTRVGAHEGKVELQTGASEVTVKEGSVYDTFCEESTLPVRGAGRFYCVAVSYDLPRGGARRGVDGPIGHVGFDVALRVDEPPGPESAEMCALNVATGTERCTSHPFRELVGPTFVRAGDVCHAPSAPADYRIRWRIGEVDVPVPLTAHVPARDPFWADFQPPQPCLRSTENALP